MGHDRAQQQFLAAIYALFLILKGVVLKSERLSNLHFRSFTELFMPFVAKAK